MSNLFFSMFLKKLFSYIILFGANRLILSGKYLILLHFYYVFKEFIMILSCSNICKSFGENDILKQVSFHIEDHEKAAIVGTGVWHIKIKKDTAKPWNRLIFCQIFIFII